MNLPPLEVPSAVDACVAALKRAILHGSLAAGEHLPPERELATRLGVSRTTVRTAITQLEQARLVAVRPGVGVLVLDPAAEGGPDLIVELANHGDLPSFAADLLHVRRSLARAVLEALPPKPSDAAIHRMSAAIDAQEAGVSLPPTQFAALDVAVARALVEATGRIGLRLCMNPVLDVLPRLPALCAAMFHAPMRHVNGWRSVRDWLATEPASPQAIDAFVALLEARDAETLSRLGAAP
jgi:GntR family transcriptional repressor for pyruvate dehydrogenase complex